MVQHFKEILAKNNDFLLMTLIRLMTPTFDEMGIFEAKCRISCPNPGVPYVFSVRMSS